MRIKNHLAKILLLIALFSVSDVEWTNAAFQDYETSVGNTITAGCWAPPTIPNLNSPEDGLITSEKPTLKWNDSQIVCPGESNLRYQVRVRSSNPDESYEHISEWITETEFAVPSDIGDSEYIWEVRAKDSTNEESDWSDTRTFTIDTTSPVVEINSPDNGNTVKETVSIKATVTDSNPHHYWFEIFDEDGDRVAGVGTVNESEELEDDEIYEWDTTKVDDGEYVLKLEARDAAGNKSPDEAPVLNDSNDPDDSVDWITVTVDNVSDSGGSTVSLMTTFSASTSSVGENLLPPSEQKPEEPDKPDSGDSAPKTVLLPEQKDEEPKLEDTKEDYEDSKEPEDTDNPTEPESPKEPEPTTLEDPPEENEDKDSDEEATLVNKEEDDSEDEEEDDEEPDEEDKEEPEESEDSIESII